VSGGPLGPGLRSQAGATGGDRQRGDREQGAGDQGQGGIAGDIQEQTGRHAGNGAGRPDDDVGEALQPNPLRQVRVPHAFHVDSAEARLLLLFGPAGVEGFFREGGKPARSLGLPPAGEEFLDKQALTEIARRYNQEFIGPPLPPKP